MLDHPIRILASNSTTGTLTLSDHGRTKVYRRNRVTWRIGSDSGVASITAIQKKPGSVQIFSTPPRRQGRNWQGVISSTAPNYAEFDYSIFWNGTDGSGPHEYDPKIAVMPSVSFAFKKKLVFFLLVVVGLLSLGFLHRNKE